MPTTIVNLKYYKEKDYKYIGRGSIFGSPYEISTDCSREQSIEKYKKWFEFLLKDQIFVKELGKLRGQKLGCWCKEPDKEIACHGDIIKEYLEKYCNNVPETFKLGVCGSRGWVETKTIYRILDKNIEKISMIVSGGCLHSPDETARQWAQERGIPILIHYPKWKKEDGTTDKAAGMRRNHLIVRDSDKIVAFRLNMSRGTTNTIEIAQKAGKPVKIFDRDII